MKQHEKLISIKLDKFITRSFTGRLLVVLLVLIPLLGKANCAVNGTSYEACFTPAENCRQKIIDTVINAKESILVQAYYFTVLKIAEALVNAKEKGVQVKVILDKGQISDKNVVIPYLRKNKIDVYIDYKPAIAHSKLIVIDNEVVIGGSYNYTDNAASRNAENVTIIKDKEFAKRFVTNWRNRKKHSLTYARKIRLKKRDINNIGY